MTWILLIDTDKNNLNLCGKKIKTKK